MTNKAIKQLDQLAKKEQPFFMALGFLNLIYHLMPQKNIGTYIMKKI